MGIAIVIIVAVVGGIAAGLQTQAMNVMTTRAGALEAVFVAYGSGGLAIALILLLVGGGDLGDLRGSPWWVYAAGLLGLVVVAAIGISASELGLARSMVLFTTAMLTLGAVVDHFGWLGAPIRTIDLARVSGLALVLIGTWLVVRDQ
jgi:transporter family-2 protein